MTQLSTEQVEAVVQWMYEWEQLRNSEIPMRFREDFTKWITYTPLTAEPTQKDAKE